MDIKLRFINRSSGGHDREIVIFQRNLALDLDALTVAWKVIRYCGRDCTHPFVYPQAFDVSVTDEWGNFSPRVKASDGQRLSVAPTAGGGRRLLVTGKATRSRELQVLNAMQRGALDVCLFKAGGLLGIKSSVAPGQKALFQYLPTLWIGVASDVVRGAAVNSAVLSSVTSELSLLGVQSADIVMTGGGTDESAAPYEFNLENIVPG